MIEEYSALTKEVKFNKIFLLSDLHFGIRGNSLEWLQNQIQFFKEFYIPFLKENVKKDDILFILGDIHDNRQLIDINVLNNTISLIEELSKIIRVYILTGNHDIYKKFDTDINSLVSFKYIKNVFIIEKPTIITNGDSDILVLPWIGDKDAEEKWIKNNKADYIFLHADIYGFKYDNGKEINKGVNFSTVKVKRVFGGHIHKRQESEKLIYIGSPYHTKRSDIGNQKGVYIFDPSKNEYKFFENKISPIFQRVHLDSILDLTIDDVVKIFSNNYTDIIVPDKWIHLFNLTKFIELLSNCNYKKIETINERKQVSSEISDILDDVDIRDIPTLLNLSIKELKQEDKILEKLQELNKKYYEKATKFVEELNYNSINN